MVATVILPIPDKTYHRLELNAQATGQSIEEILIYVLQIGSPPMGEDSVVNTGKCQGLSMLDSILIALDPFKSLFPVG